MRISNIKQYLGGADNVIARDIIEGDQFVFNFKIGSEVLTNYTFEVDTQLFQADVTTSGSNLTINSLEPKTSPAINETGTINIANGTTPTASSTVLSSLGITLNSLTIPTGFELKVTRSDGTELIRTADGTFVSNINQYALRVNSNGTDIDILHTSQVAGGDVLTITYNKAAGGIVHSYPTSGTDTIIKVQDPATSADLLIPSTLLSDLDSTIHSTPDSTKPYVIAMSISIINQAAITATTGTKRTFRLLWIVRYRPMV